MIILPGGGIDNALLFGAPGCRGLPWGVRQPAGGRLPAAGVPARQGQGPFLFLRKKKRALTPKKKGARSTAGWWWSTAACGFTLCLGTSPGRYGHAIGEQGKAGGSILRPPGCATLAAECGAAPGASRPTKSPAPPQGRHLTTPAMREAPAGGGWIERKPVPVSQGQAVTAGRGPSCHTKDASRRFLPETCRRPVLSFSLG